MHQRRIGEGSGIHTPKPERFPSGSPEEALQAPRRRGLPQVEAKPGVGEETPIEIGAPFDETDHPVSGTNLHPEPTAVQSPIDPLGEGSEQRRGEVGEQFPKVGARPENVLARAGIGRRGSLGRRAGGDGGHGSRLQEVQAPLLHGPFDVQRASPDRFQPQRDLHQLADRRAAERQGSFGNARGDFSIARHAQRGGSHAFPDDRVSTTFRRLDQQVGGASGIAGEYDSGRGRAKHPLDHHPHPDS